MDKKKGILNFDDDSKCPYCGIEIEENSAVGTIAQQIHLLRHELRKISR